MKIFNSKYSKSFGIFIFFLMVLMLIGNVTVVYGAIGDENEACKPTAPRCNGNLLCDNDPTNPTCKAACATRAPGCYKKGSLDAPQTVPPPLSRNQFKFYIKEVPPVNECIPESDCVCPDNSVVITDVPSLGPVRYDDADYSLEACTTCIAPGTPGMWNTEGSLGTQCCGDDVPNDCGLIGRSLSGNARGNICNVDENNGIAEWKISDAETRGDILYIQCSNQEYLSKGGAWVTCDGSDNWKKAVTKTGETHDYLCLGQGPESIVECCGADPANCFSDKQGGKRVTAGAQVNPKNFAEGTTPPTGPYRIFVRRTAPSTSTISISQAVVITASVSDSVGLQRIKISIDGSVVETCNNNNCQSRPQTFSVGNHPYSAEAEYTDSTKDITSPTGSFTVGTGDGEGGPCPIAGEIECDGTCRRPTCSFATDCNNPNLPICRLGGTCNAFCGLRVQIGGRVVASNSILSITGNVALCSQGNCNQAAPSCGLNQNPVCDTTSNCWACTDSGITSTDQTYICLETGQFVTCLDNNCAGPPPSPPPSPTQRKSACIAAGFSWTGTSCCGDNSGEYYNDPTENSENTESNQNLISGAVVAGERITGYQSAPPGFSESSINWHDRDISGWAQTVNGLSVSFQGDEICLRYSEPASWIATGEPNDEGKPITIANAWLIAQVNGQWHAATWEYVRTTWQCKGTGNLIPPENALGGALGSFSPQAGQHYGFLVSGLARAGKSSVQEKSNIDWVTWPSGLGGSSSSSSGGFSSPSTGIGGCWNDDPVFSVSFAPDTSDSVINYGGVFHGCALDKGNYVTNGNELLDLDDDASPGNKLITNHDYCFITPSGNNFCDYTEQWLPTDGELRNHFTEVPDQGLEQAGGCCLQGQCWDGGSCIESQNNESFADTFGNGLRCIDGDWEQQNKKCTPDGNTCAFCASDSQCLLRPFDTQNPCIESGEYDKDNFCDNGEWSSRTKQLALKLLELKTGDYTLFCDTKENTLNDLQYAFNQQISVGGILADLQTNNFCVLKAGNLVVGATSLNKNLSDVIGGINVFGTTSCPNAKDDGRYVPCNSAQTVWYNQQLKSIIFSKFPLPSLEGPVSSNFIVDIIRNIVNKIKQLITPPFDNSFLTGINKFSRLYMSEQSGKAIFGAIEGEGFNIRNLVLEYRGFNTDICAFVNNPKIPSDQVSGLECEQSGNSYFVLGQGLQTTNLNPDTFWQDLTSKLRIS